MCSLLIYIILMLAFLRIQNIFKTLKRSLINDLSAGFTRSLVFLGAIQGEQNIESGKSKSKNDPRKFGYFVNKTELKRGLLSRSGLYIFNSFTKLNGNRNQSSQFTLEFEGNIISKRISRNIKPRLISSLDNLEDYFSLVENAYLEVQNEQRISQNQPIHFNMIISIYFSGKFISKFNSFLFSVGNGECTKTVFEQNIVERELLAQTVKQLTQQKQLNIGRQNKSILKSVPQDYTPSVPFQGFIQDLEQSSSVQMIYCVNQHPDAYNLNKTILNFSKRIKQSLKKRKRSSSNSKNVQSSRRGRSRSKKRGKSGNRGSQKQKVSQGFVSFMDQGTDSQSSASLNQ